MSTDGSDNPPNAGSNHPAPQEVDMHDPSLTLPHARAGGRERRQIDSALEHIRQALVGLQFGEILVVIQDGVIVQVERTERKRFRKGDR